MRSADPNRINEERMKLVSLPNVAVVQAPPVPIGSTITEHTSSAGSTLNTTILYTVFEYYTVHCHYYVMRDTS